MGSALVDLFREANYKARHAHHKALSFLSTHTSPPTSMCVLKGDQQLLDNVLHLWQALHGQPVTPPSFVDLLRQRGEVK